MNAIFSSPTLHRQPQEGLVPGGGTFPFLQAMKNPERSIPGTGLCFKILTEPHDLEEVFRLRYQVFCEEMHIVEPEDCPDGKESDDYDPHCLHTAVIEQGRIIAYTRLVLPCEEFPLERTNYLPRLFDRGQSVEVSRALLVKAKRGPGDVIWYLFNSIYALCQEGGLDAILSFSNAVMYNGYKKRGVPFRYVGDPVTFHGHKSHPLIIDVDQHRTPNFLLH